MKNTYSVYTDLDMYCTKGIESLEEAHEIAERYAREGHEVEIRDDVTGDTVELLNIADEEDEIVESKLWYAVMRDRDDIDWGTGSYDLDEARELMNDWRKDGWTDAYIAVIDESGELGTVCVDEICD
jgi:hypothetical protein